MESSNNLNGNLKADSCNNINPSTEQLNDQTASTSSPSKNRVKRKQWVLHDGPHGSLQRLRLRMAEEGCGHSQVALAKQYLSENCCNSDQLAIHWLLKAADQGNYEGLEILKNCYENNRGVTEHNCHKIRSFLEMSQHERAARLGAKNLFSSMAQGSDFITTKQLEQWLEESLASSKEKEENSVQNSCLVPGGELISEQHMMSAASIYATGHFPPLLRLINFQSQKTLSYLFHWLTRNILNTFTHSSSILFIFIFIIIVAAMNTPLQILLSLQLPSLVIIVSWIGALMACVILTAQSCRLVKDWNMFHRWSLLLSQHAQQLQPTVPEYLYLTRTFPPHFGRFILAAVPCVSLQPALLLVRSSLPHTELWIPYGELGVLASLLCSACWPYMRFVWTMTLDDVLCLTGWILWRMQHSAFSVYTSQDFHFHPALKIRVHVIAVLGLLILVPLYARRLRQFDHFTHLFAWLLPHIASLIWLYLAIDWFQLSTYDGVLRGLILSLAIALLRSNCNKLTKANLLLCCLTSYSTGTEIGLTPWIALGLAVTFLSVCRLSCQFWTLQRIQRPLLHVWTFFKSVLFVVCVAILVLRVVDRFQLSHPPLETSPEESSLAVAAAPQSIEDDGEPLEPVGDTISWQQYRKYCSHQPLGATTTLANTQLACSVLNGVNVQWEGVVRQISIAHRENLAETLLNWLPSKWASWLTCQMGEKWPECDTKHTHPQSFHYKRCHLLWRINQQRGRHCHFDRFSKFTLRYEVEPNVDYFWDSKLTVELVAGPSFQALGFRLKPGSVVGFEGTLSAPTLGNVKPEVHVTSLECVSCQPASTTTTTTFPTEEDEEQKSTSILAIPWNLASLMISSLQGTADFVLPHFIRLNVTQLWTSNSISY